MKKKILLSLFVIVALFTITGCGNTESKSESGNNEKGKNDIVCTRSSTYSTYSLERELVFKIDDNNKLTKVVDSSKYSYNDESKYKSDCATVKEQYDGKEKIAGTEDTYNCNDSNKTITVVATDIIKDLDADAKTRRYKELNEDGTFNFEEWKSTVGEKNKWNCNK